jgi:hypothetical protein
MEPRGYVRLPLLLFIAKFLATRLNPDFRQLTPLVPSALQNLTAHAIKAEIDRQIRTLQDRINHPRTEDQTEGVPYLPINRDYLLIHNRQKLDHYVLFPALRAYQTRQLSCIPYARTGKRN